MLRIIAALIDSLPRIFDWGLAPGALALLLLAFSQRTRSGAALGLVAIAALSISLLSIPAIELAYIAWRFGRVAWDLFLGFGPAQAFGFLSTVSHSASFGALDLALMIATTFGSSIAAAALNRDRDQPERS